MTDLLVIGGGVIGIEFAGIYKALWQPGPPVPAG